MCVWAGGGTDKNLSQKLRQTILPDPHEVVVSHQKPKLDYNYYAATGEHFDEEKEEKKMKATNEK